MLRLALSIAALCIAATTAQAHTGIGDTHGFAQGFVHPFGGIDHVLAMVAVGLFAVRLGGRALWLVPLSFVSAMAIAGVMATAGLDLPFVETGIGLSVVVLGVAVASGLHLPTAAAIALVGFFAVFHGHAHCVKMSASTSSLAYALGFVLATASLHAIGIGLGLGAGQVSATRGNHALQAAGSAMALAGVAILFQL